MTENNQLDPEDDPNVPTLRKARMMAWQVSCAIHSKTNFDRVFLIDGHVSRTYLKKYLADLLKTWDIADPYLEYLHMDMPRDPEKFTRKEYVKHALRDYRATKHVSTKVKEAYRAAQQHKKTKTVLYTKCKQSNTVKECETPIDSGL